MMRLQYLTANAAWAFVFGDDITPMGNWGRFFATRDEAIAAALQQGLRVDAENNVSSIPGESGRQPWENREDPVTWTMPPEVATAILPPADTDGRERLGNILHLANILDPIASELDPRVFLHPEAPKPILRPELAQWITHTIYEVLERYGYDHPDRWLTGVFTGSLCTYQYSDRADADLNLFVDAERLPDWSRAELAAIVVKNIDPLKLPGTPYQMQTFIQPPGITIKDHFRPGLHAGFIVFGQGSGQWASPPEREAAHDVERERNDAYLAGLMAADKLDLLLRYEPDEAKTFWHQLHSKRREDMRHDMGDFATSNVIFKMLVNRFGEDPVARLSRLASEVPDHFAERGYVFEPGNFSHNPSTVGEAAARAKYCAGTGWPEWEIVEHLEECGFGEEAGELARTALLA